MPEPSSKPGRMRLRGRVPSFVLRFISTIALWSIALLITFSGFEILFWLLISVFGMIGLLGILPDARSQRSAEFQSHRNDLRRRHARRQFLLLLQDGAGRSYDFEVAVLLFFLLTVFARQMFARLRHDEPLQTMAYTLFGLLYVLWLFNFTTKIVYLTPPLSNGVLTGQFYVLYLIAVTKFADMGAYLTGSAIGRHLMVPHISAKKTWEGFFGAIGFALFCSLALFKLMPGHLSVLTWTHATILGLLLGFAAVIGDLAESIIKRSTGVKDSGNLLPGIGGALDLLDSLLFTAPLLFFYLRLVIHVP